MMEFETWNRDTLIKELKTAMMQAHSKPRDNFLGMANTPKLYTDKELHQKNDHELRFIYAHFKRYDDTFRQEFEENEEKRRFFNQQTSQADFNYWSKQAYWTIEEAITLALGKDPRKVSWEDIKIFLPTSAFAKKFHEILELAKRYVNCKELFDPVFPGIFLAWAERMRINIPDELKEGVNAVGVQVADWKSHYEEATKKYTQLNNLYTETRELIKAKEKLIEALNLRISNFETTQEQQPKVDDLKETERQSLYKLIAAMAYDGYGYDPSSRSPLPTELVNAVTLLLGEKIDDGTARKWLKLATERYPKINAGKTE